MKNQKVFQYIRKTKKSKIINYYVECIICSGFRLFLLVYILTEFSFHYVYFLYNINVFFLKLWIPSFGLTFKILV